MSNLSNSSPDEPTDELVLEYLPNGETIWLRPRPAADVRYVLTTLGRAAIKDTNQ